MPNDLKSLIDQGVTRLRADGLSASDIARALIHKHWATMADADKCELAGKGLAVDIRTHAKTSHANSEVGVKREERREKQAEVFTKANTHLRKQIEHTVYGALRTISLDCDGRTQSLLRFTPSDLTAWLSLASEQTGLWRKRKMWFERAREEMRRMHADRVADLPPAILATLNTMAEMAWERDDARIA